MTKSSVDWNDEGLLSAKSRRSTDRTVTAMVNHQIIAA